MRVCIYVCVYLCKYVCICVCMNIYTYIYVPTCVAMKLIDYISGSKMSKQETLMNLSPTGGIEFYTDYV